MILSTELTINNIMYLLIVLSVCYLQGELVNDEENVYVELLEPFRQIILDQYTK